MGNCRTLAGMWRIAAIRRIRYFSGELAFIWQIIG